MFTQFAAPKKPLPFGININSSDSLEGVVKAIHYHNPSNGFTAMRIEVDGYDDPISVAGSSANLRVGEFVECSGEWENTKYGPQLKCQFIRSVPPRTLEGIEKFLGSGRIKGIGPGFAKKMVKRFGDKVLDVIENTPEELLSIPGFGKKRLESAIASWSMEKHVEKIITFLQSHGVSTDKAYKIHKAYGDKAVDIVKENPYRLALEIHGIGFQMADNLAQSLGIPKDSIFRARAGVQHFLKEWSNAGHCAAYKGNLIRDTAKMLDVDGKIVEDAIKLETLDGNLMQDQVNGVEAIFLRQYYTAEISCAYHLLRIRDGKTRSGATMPWGRVDVDVMLPWVREQTGLTLSDTQQDALRLALANKLTVITGGPGVGKTTLVNSILKILKLQNINIALCAPTGRAAKRLSESTGMEAKTVHRLLEFNPEEFDFKYNEDNQLDVDCVVIDESSMMDIVLMDKLLKAIPDKSALLIIGDVDQLPSVGAGAVLADVINSEAIATVKLTEVRRQAAGSKIITNAHAINHGSLPELPKADEESDFYCIFADSAETVHDRLIQVVTQRIPEKFGFDPISDIQVLVPMRKGLLGVHELNKLLQEKLNGNSSPTIRRGDATYAVGDKVIQMVNNYEKEVFNGDIGRVYSVDPEAGEMLVGYEGRLVTYEREDLDEISLAYATTIHKSQGSEYPVVVIPLASSHHVMLERNLLYTGVTRGRKLVVVVCEKKAMIRAIQTQSSKKRITNLVNRLKGIV